LYAQGGRGNISASNVTLPNSYGYSGREFAEDGLYYFRARYLSKDLARFLSYDPLEVQPMMSIDNPYAYVGNSPIGHTDPFGLFRIDKSCSIPPYSTASVHAGVMGWCKQVFTNKTCKAFLKDLGVYECLAEQCSNPNSPSIACDCAVDQPCGRRQGIGKGFTLGKDVTDPSSGCGGFAGTIGHEAFLLCWGYRELPNDHYMANMVTVACLWGFGFF
jgi:RHS repeat-associated protein